ncbi:hypothetical protein QE422_000623 [Chryseobacterium sp. SORGH_AS 447]|nr:hypothetical protein [Chryseobacterium sp. SORGH_AS_0447]
MENNKEDLNKVVIEILKLLNGRSRYDNIAILERITETVNKSSVLACVFK